MVFDKLRLTSKIKSIKNPYRRKTYKDLLFLYHEVSRNYQLPRNAGPA